MNKHLVKSIQISLLFMALSSAQERPIGINLYHISYADPLVIFRDVMKQCAPWWVQDAAGHEWHIDSVTVPQRPDGYPLQAGKHDLVWHAVKRSSGVYFIKISGQGIEEKKKILFLK